MGSAPARGNTCAGLVEGFGIGSVQTTMVYNRDTADADSNGPGSTWGRTHGIGWDQGSSANASQTTATPPSSRYAQQYAACIQGHAQEPHDAADTQPADSPTSVIVEHTATPAVTLATPRPEQKTRHSSESQKYALASAGEQQTEQKQMQTRTTHTVDAPQQVAQPEAAAATTATATAIEDALDMPSFDLLVLVDGSWHFASEQPVAANAEAAGEADAAEDALPSAEEPAWLQQAWAQVHDKDLVDADPDAPGTGLTGHFEGASAAGPPASAPAAVATSPDTPLALEHASALSQVLVTGVLVGMLDTA